MRLLRKKLGNSLWIHIMNAVATFGADVNIATVLLREDRL